VARLVGTRASMGKMALVSRVRGRRPPRILHLATHGFFLANPERQRSAALKSVVLAVDSGPEWLTAWSQLESPLLRSGLALARAKTWLEGGRLPPNARTGFLTAEEVTSLDLLDTELVVLSACETGLGEVRAGEGVFGLRRAFILAGAKTLVMSLWKVPDQQTQVLLVDFYERILTGMPRAEALRQAQLAMKAIYPNPLYWGAFICQGDPGRLPRYSAKAHP
jgi:CHAT domain-containing protein